jgi:hypothetical protein
MMGSLFAWSAPRVSMEIENGRQLLRLACKFGLAAGQI